jgi:hypothetical protein
MEIIRDIIIGALGSLIASGLIYLFGRKLIRKTVRRTILDVLGIYDYSLRLGEIQDQFRELLTDIETEPVWFDRRQIDRETFYNLKRICDELREVWIRLDQTLKIFDVLRGGSSNV